MCTTKKGLSSYWLIPSVRTCQCVCASTVLFMSCPLICRNRTSLFYPCFLLSCVQSVLLSFDVTSLLVFCTSPVSFAYVCLSFVTMPILYTIMLYIHKSSRPFLINSVSIIERWVVRSSFCTPSVTYLRLKLRCYR